MNRILQKYHKLYFPAFLALLLIASILQHHFQLIEEKPLFGDITYQENPEFSLKSWRNSEFQSKKEIYLNESLGFRNLFVRLKNQIDFFLFKKSNANEVIIGKNNYLFEKKYLESSLGLNFIGKNEIKKKCDQLQFIQNELKKINKTLLVVIAPGKGFYYPEFIPDNYYKQKQDSTNYLVYLKNLTENKINLIDFNGKFFNDKNNTSYPLFPQYGIHWSFWSSCYALDSIIKKLEKIHQCDLANLHMSKPVFYPPAGGDYDIGFGLNLFSTLHTFEMAYGEMHFDSISNKPCAITIADSFYWSQYNLGLKSVFKNHHFWFYYRQKYPENTLISFCEKQNILQEILKNEIVIILTTEANLENFGWGFIEDCFNGLKNKNLPK